MKRYKVKFHNETPYVKINKEWLEVMLMDQQYLKREWERQLPGISTKTKYVYELRINGEFKTWECMDADCPINGCKHSACFKAQLTQVDKTKYPQEGVMSAMELELKRIATQVLAARDALVLRDYDDAYHQLYLIASPNLDSTDPWAELEALANRKVDKTRKQKLKEKLKEFRKSQPNPKNGVILKNDL